MISQIIAIPLIVILCLLRIAYLRTQPMNKDVRDAFVPCLGRLHARDFFRAPTTFEVRDAFWGLPYGVIWFAMNFPLMRAARFNGKLWVYLIGMIDGVFIWLSLLLGPVGAVVYAAISTFNLLRAPWNVSILWLTILGVFSWIFLILAPVAKLPFGVPVYVWKHLRMSMTHQHNSLYYGVLGVLWIYVFWRTIIPWFLSATILGQIASFGT